MNACDLEIRERVVLVNLLEPVNALDVEVHQVGILHKDAELLAGHQGRGGFDSSSDDSHFFLSKGWGKKGGCLACFMRQFSDPDVRSRVEVNIPPEHMDGELGLVPSICARFWFIDSCVERKHQKICPTWWTWRTRSVAHKWLLRSGTMGAISLKDHQNFRRYLDLNAIIPTWKCNKM